jgi:DNA-binding XRE family transcriptional regulator
MMATKDVTVFQLRAARAGLGMSISELHQKTGIGRSTITRIEQQPLNEPPSCNPTIVYHLRQFFETNGVIFENANKISFSSQEIEY